MLFSDLNGKKIQKGGDKCKHRADSLCRTALWLRRCKAAIAVVVAQSLSHVQPFANPWTAAYQASLSFTISQSFLNLKSIESVMPSNHLILCHPLLLLPSFLPSIRGFSNVSALHIRWPKYWSFSFSISPSNEHSGWSSFRIDWFELLVVQGTLKSLLQFCSSKASILWLSAFFMVWQALGWWWGVDKRAKKVTNQVSGSLSGFTTAQKGNLYNHPFQSEEVEAQSAYLSGPKLCRVL